MVTKKPIKANDILPFAYVFKMCGNTSGTLDERREFIVFGPINRENRQMYGI